MKLVIIFGPHAVGKMTVGQELSKLTGLKLFHNHMTIDIVSELFENMPAERSRLTGLFRREIFEAYAKSDEYGMIFTFMWAFDMREDWDYVANVQSLFEAHGATVYFVELEAGYDLRLARNKTENRLLNKPTKRDLARSEALFKRLEDKYRLNSLPGELKEENYLRIDNTDLLPEEAARIIKERFSL
ncbi:MAG: AAA family ATPase [Clostridiaceae bacterium]|nr:AAA family ATPase [Eubacteriales bacterium]